MIELVGVIVGWLTSIISMYMSLSFELNGSTYHLGTILIFLLLFGIVTKFVVNKFINRNGGGTD